MLAATATGPIARMAARTCRDSRSFGMAGVSWESGGGTGTDAKRIGTVAPVAFPPIGNGIPPTPVRAGHRPEDR
ncbi:hypothetical protein GCM10023222_28340 [Saccharopolyspora cebuensis]